MSIQLTKRLRNRVTGLFLLVTGAGIAGMALHSVWVYVKDKREYVMELNSIAALNAASAVSKYTSHLVNQFEVMDSILRATEKRPIDGTLLQTAFRKLDGVLRLDVFDESGMVASIAAEGFAAASDPTSRKVDSALLERVRGNPRARTLHFDPSSTLPLILSVPIGKRVFISYLSPKTFQQYLESAHAISIRLVSKDGATIAGSSSKALGETLPGEILEQAHQAAPETPSTRGVISKALDSREGPSLLFAAAAIPATEGAIVVADAPAATVSQMLWQVTIESVPSVAVLLVLAALMGVMLSRQLTHPIEELTEATSQIAAGVWTVPLMPRRADEIGRLMEAFTKMGSELADREAALKKAHDELVRSERLAVLGQFSAGVAHEVKNPLNSILGFAQLLQQKTKQLQGDSSDESVGKYLGFLMDETRRASRIISDLLTFARQKPPTLAPVNLGELIDRVCEMFQPQVATHQSEIEKIVEDREVKASLDRDQMAQVFTNLIMNALHAMEDKAEGELRKVTLRARSEKDWAVIEISDTGSGISPENISRIFEPFFSTKKTGKGTGLGLSMCHGIVTQHQGRIDVASEPGKGTTFVIRLPKG